MNAITPGDAPTPADSLHAELRTLIASSRQRLAGAVNAELTRLYWVVGQRLRTAVLGGTDRAKYGDQLIQRVGEQLAQEFGRGFEAKNLRRMVQFAQVFAQPEIVATLSRQLSWSHFVNLIPLKTEQARQFYADQSAAQTWSVRELRQQIERKAFERTELASLQVASPIDTESAAAVGNSPALVFKDLYFLDFLGLRQGHDEADLEAAIIIKLPTLRDEAFAIADRKNMDLCPSALAQRKLPHRVRKRSGAYQLGADAIQVMTMTVSEGLEFQVVALRDVGYLPAPGEDKKEAERVFHVAATRATQRLVMGVGGGGRFF